MIASLLFLLLGYLLGFSLLRIIKSPLKIEEQLIWAIPIGIMLLTMWVFMLALVLPHQDWAIIVGTITAASLVFYYFNLDRNRAQLRKDWVAFRKSLDRPTIIAWLFVLLPWLIDTFITIPRLLFWRDGNLIAGWINVWGDWALHLRTSTFFAAHDKLSLESPIYSGTQFHYPYLTNYLSAILQRLGLDIARSLTWPTVALFGSLPPILYLFGRRLTGSRRAGVLFAYLVLLSGGLGIYYLVRDIAHGHYFWQATAYSPLTYTDYGRVNGQSVNSGIWFMNFIMSEFIPQRSFLAGIGIALFVLMIAWEALTAKVSRTNLIAAGVLFGCLPLIHSHSFIALGCLIPVAFLYKLCDELLRTKKSVVEVFKRYVGLGVPLFLPAALLGFTLVYFFVFDLHSTSSFAHPVNWWVPQPEKPVNIISYWWRNAGPFIVLAALALLGKGKLFRPLALGALIIFIVCNRYSFQPWQYDNLKLLTYWYIIWALPLALFLANLSRKTIIVAALLVLLLTGAGLADTLTVTVSAQSGGLQLSTAGDLAFAQLVQRATAKDPDGLIISATGHDNPISIASGRRMYEGFEGWLWTYGIDWSPRLQEIQEMYKATPAGLALIKQKNIHYIALGPQEIERYKPDEEKLAELFPVVVDFGQYKLLRVK